MPASKLIIQSGAFDNAHKIASGFGVRFAIITDTHTKKLGKKLLSRFKREGLSTDLITIKAGESYKRLSTIEACAETLLARGIHRDGCIIAVGGGVICDVVGFLASIYMRGISHILIPTTLLAMADASIGGKTGVDLLTGKNIIGTFYKPRAIIIDPQALHDLPDNEYRAGFAEIIKHAVIADARLFEELDKNCAALLKREENILEKILKRSCKIKMDIVRHDSAESLKKADNKDTSRMLLNYGHTVGHAIERISAYKIPHGVAVAMGMIAENKIAVGKKLLSASHALRIEKLIAAYKLPTKLPGSITQERLRKSMLDDKKVIGGKVHFALPTRIGHARIVSYDLN